MHRVNRQSVREKPSNLGSVHGALAYQTDRAAIVFLTDGGTGSWTMAAPAILLVSMDEILLMCSVG